MGIAAGATSAVKDHLTTVAQAASPIDGSLGDREGLFRHVFVSRAMNICVLSPPGFLFIYLYKSSAENEGCLVCVHSPHCCVR